MLLQDETNILLGMGYSLKSQEYEQFTWTIQKPTIL